MKKELFLKKYGLTESQFTGEEPISGDLYLSSVTSLPEGFNPTVGGDLYLSSVTSLPEGFNPTVGGYLDLRSVTSLPEGFNPTVGGSLYWNNGNKHRHIGAAVNTNFFWNKNNKRYAVIDGMFCEVLTERNHATGGQVYNIYSAKKVNREEYFFIASNGDYYAHGADLRKAIEDLGFKVAAEKLKKEPIAPDTIVSVQHYRAITGACELGCKSWLDSNGITATQMKASELLPLLEKTNAYGLQQFKKLITF